MACDRCGRDCHICRCGKCFHCFGYRCDCTRYAKKRRLLREHRQEMRVMVELLEERGLERELEERLVEVTGNTQFWLGVDDDGPNAMGMDEGSDQEDPEAVAKDRVRSLLGEAEDRTKLLEAVEGAASNRAIVKDVEHARMRLKDSRAQLLRERATVEEASPTLLTASGHEHGAAANSSAG